MDVVDAGTHLRFKMMRHQAVQNRKFGTGRLKGNHLSLIHILDGVITKIKRVMQSALAKIQKTLMQPEVKKAGKEQIKEKARESIRDKLAKDKLDADRDNRERWEREGRIAPTKKHDMEL